MRMRLIFIVSLIAAPAIAQTLTSAEAAELARATKNPFELARFIDKHPAGSWDVEWKSPSLSVKPSRSVEEAGFCAAQVVSVMVPEQAIVIVQCESSSTSDQYVRYSRRSDGAWKCEGLREFFIRHGATSHQLSREDGQRFLRVSHYGDSGTGLNVELEDWFDLTRPGFEPIFDFPVRGNYNQPYVIGTEFTAAVTANEGQLLVELMVKFETDISEEHVTPLGERELEATYRRDGSGKFQCASVRGDEAFVSCADFKALSTSGGPSEEDLVRLSLRVLKEVATGSNGHQKRWLRRYLAQRKDTPEVRELRSLLK
jgi:hypothetical protein